MLTSFFNLSSRFPATSLMLDSRGTFVMQRFCGTSQSCHHFRSFASKGSRVCFQSASVKFLYFPVCLVLQGDSIQSALHKLTCVKNSTFSIKLSFFDVSWYILGLVKAARTFYRALRIKWFPTNRTKRVMGSLSKTAWWLKWCILLTFTSSFPSCSMARDNQKAGRAPQTLQCLFDIKNGHSFWVWSIS